MKLVIEVDGEIHNDPEVAAYDKVRTNNLNENKLTVYDLRMLKLKII